MRLYNEKACTLVATPRSTPRSFDRAAETKTPLPSLEPDMSGRNGEEASRLPSENQGLKGATVFCPWLMSKDTASTSSSSGTFDFEIAELSGDSFHFDISVLKDSKGSEQTDLQDENFSRTTSSTISTRASLEKVFSESLRNSESTMHDKIFDTFELPPPSRVVKSRISRDDWKTSDAGVEQRNTTPQEHLRSGERVSLFPKMLTKSSNRKVQPDAVKKGRSKQNWFDEPSWEVFNSNHELFSTNDEPHVHILDKDTAPTSAFSVAVTMPPSDQNLQPSSRGSNLASKDCLRLKMDRAPVRPWKEREMRIAQESSSSSRLSSPEGRENTNRTIQVPPFLASVLEERYQRAKKNDLVERCVGAHPATGVEDKDRGKIKLEHENAVDEMGFPFGAEDEAVILMVRSSEEDICRPVTKFVRSQEGQWSEFEVER